MPPEAENGTLMVDVVACALEGEALCPCDRRSHTFTSYRHSRTQSAASPENDTLPLCYGQFPCDLSRGEAYTC